MHQIIKGLWRRSYPRKDSCGIGTHKVEIQPTIDLVEYGGLWPACYYYFYLNHNNNNNIQHTDIITIHLAVLQTKWCVSLTELAYLVHVHVATCTTVP